MKIVIGLGNPGVKYNGTAHNLGFDVANILAGRWGEKFTHWGKEKSDGLEAFRNREKVVVAKPMTWMNLSGQAAAELMRNRPAELDDLLVVSDDTNIPLGTLRIRSEGSHGGHNGLRSIIGCLGDQNFCRLRIGVQPEGNIHDLAAYVLSKPPKAELEKYKIMAQIAADAVEYWIENHTEETANKFNGLDEFS